MARGTAGASVHSDSIKGLAQCVADPTYRRLLTAEPLLRRAVPVLIIAFLLTVGIGAVIQILEHRRQAFADGWNEIDRLADIIDGRLSRLDAADDPQAALARVLPSSLARHVSVLASDADDMLVAAWPARMLPARETLTATLGTVVAQRAGNVMELRGADGASVYAVLRDL